MKIMIFTHINKQQILILFTLLTFLRTQQAGQTQEEKESNLYLEQKIISMHEKEYCTLNSPISNFDYGLKKVAHIRGISFCEQYAKRTCCSDDNFTEVKRKWFRQYTQSIKMSSQCQQNFQQLVCYDCDGDIGIENRRGLCPSLCINLYESCKNDVFSQDDKVATKIRFCKESDILCSELQYIIKNGDLFCKALGFEVNSNINFEEWYDNLLMNATLKNPVCWDGTPSQNIFGPVATKASNNFIDKLKYIHLEMNKLYKSVKAYMNSMRRYFRI